MSVASNKLKELAVKYGFDKNKIVIAPVGVDLKRFSPKVNGSNLKRKYNLKKNVILYLGQLHGAQYVELVIKAFSKLNRTDTSLMIVGGGSNKNNLVKYSEKLNVKNNVVFTGYIKAKDVPKYIAVSEIAVASFEKNKITECKSPLKVVEYLAMGKAIVASEVGEVKRMVGEAGIIVKPGKSSEITKAINKLLSDPKLRKKLEKKARIRAKEHFTWDKTARNILDAYSYIK